MFPMAAAAPSATASQELIKAVPARPVFQMVGRKLTVTIFLQPVVVLALVAVEQELAVVPVVAVIPVVAEASREVL